MLCFLLPPSEGKTQGGIDKKSTTKFSLDLPLDIASQVNEKDLKCKGSRFQEGLLLNRNISSSLVKEAILRYSGVMYSAIGYQDMDAHTKDYFAKHILILSGMYGLLSPLDLIGNYKLPIDSKGLKKFWGDKITSSLITYGNQQKVTYVDMLSGSYQKMIDADAIRASGIGYIQVNFMQDTDGILKKYTHAVKKVKGGKLRDFCENGYEKVEDLGGNLTGNILEIVC